MNHKLGVIIPYRNREKHLEIFEYAITKYLKEKNILYELIIVEQNDLEPFNRGKLLNIGFKFAKEHGCDYVVFHDVDMLPIDVDYSYSEFPVHLATNFINDNSEIFDQYFGGVTIFNVDDFEKINGYSNEYWGWGFEDDDLFLRCQINHLKLDSKEITNMGISKKMLNFNGFNSYVVSEKNFNMNDELTIFVSFYPNNMTFNSEKEFDKFTIFSIPKHDLTLSYNSFYRYVFTAFDENKKVLNLYTKIKTNYLTKIVITISKDKIIKLYQDGEFINEVSGYNKFYEYDEKEIFYLGCSNPFNKGNEHYFSGYFDAFAVFNKCLDEEQIKILSTKRFIKLDKDKLGNNSAKYLSLYYDTNKIDKYRLIDIAGTDYYGEIHNTNIEKIKIPYKKEIKIPFRRQSSFSKLKHEENGFIDNKWKDKNTRWNQLKFNDKLKEKQLLSSNDGLSKLYYNIIKKEYDKTKNKYKIKVNI